MAIPTGSIRLEEAKTLVSWKEIAAHLNRAERTVRRWERDRGLPVHRIPGGGRSGVFAYSADLEAWMRGEQGHDAQREAEAKIDREPDREMAQPVLPEVRAAAAVPSKSSTGAQKSSWHFSKRVIAWAIPPAVLILLVASSPALTSSLERVLSNMSMARWMAGKAMPAPGESLSQSEQLYEQGRYQWSLRTAESLRKSVDFYVQAILANPSFARAYAGLAESYELMPEYVGVDPVDYYARAEAAADKAIQFDPSLAAGHRAKGFALFYGDWNVTAADAEFQRALALDPNNVETRHWYATTLFSRDESASAIAQIDAALKLNPTDPALITDAAFIRAFFNVDRDANIKTLRELEQSQPKLISPSRHLAELDLDDEDYSDYLKDIAMSAAISQNPDEVALVQAAKKSWAHSGKLGVLDAIRDAEEAEYQGGKTSGYWLARAYLRLGDSKKAFQYLNAAMRRHDFTLMTLPACTCISQVKSDPEYATLLRQIREKMLGPGAPPETHRSVVVNAKEVPPGMQ